MQFSTEPTSGSSIAFQPFEEVNHTNAWPLNVLDVHQAPHLQHTSSVTTARLGARWVRQSQEKAGKVK